jgi:hypothetical protein
MYVSSKSQLAGTHTAGYLHTHTHILHAHEPLNGCVTCDTKPTTHDILHHGLPSQMTPFVLQHVCQHYTFANNYFQNSIILRIQDSITSLNY